jgi:hypothetical protein
MVFPVVRTTLKGGNAWSGVPRRRRGQRATIKKYGVVPAEMGFASRVAVCCGGGNIA